MKLLYENSAVLSTMSEPIELDSENFSDEIDEMFKILDEKNGLGLSAPQVGILKRFFIMNVDGEKKVCYNPKIVSTPISPGLEKEGCLSFPGLVLNISRYLWVEVEYYNEQFELISEKIFGLEAQCFQHELDHLNGITFDTLVPKLSLRRAREKQRKFLKKIK